MPKNKPTIFQLKIISFNIQKIRTITKFSHFWNSIKQRNYHIISLTETDLNSNKLIKNISTFVQKQDYTLIPLNITKRTILIFSNQLKLITIHPISTFLPPSSNSHYFIEDASFTYQKFSFTIASIYGPVHKSLTKNKPPIYKYEFYDELISAIKNFTSSESKHKLILTGDWNILPMDNSNISKEDFKIHSSLFDLNLLDLFLIGDNKKKHQNYTNHHYKTKNRLDRFHISINITTTYHTSYRVFPKYSFSTHHPIQMIISTSPPANSKKLSPSFYIKKNLKIPSDFHNHPRLINYIFEPTPVWTNNLPLSYDYYLHTIHSRILQLIPIYKVWKKSTSPKNLHPLQDPQYLNDLSNVSENFQKLRLRFAKPNKTEIQLSHQQTEEAIKFYQNLFQKSTTPDNPNFYTTFTNFTRNINEKLTHEEKIILTKDFTENELHYQLSTLVSKGYSSPGKDSICYKDWFIAWKQANPLITQLANYILKGKLKENSSITTVLIKLIPKKNFSPQSESSLLDTTRPISLTNSIFRLINYALTQRLMTPINRIVQYNQQAFLHNRNIHLNIETTKIIAQNLLSSQEIQQQHLFLIDFRKAFDTIDHTYIQKILELYEFPNTIIKSIITQSNTSSAYITNDNFIHKQNISLKKGVRQGLPFSPLIFILAIEPLLLRIKETISGITFNPYSKGDSQIKPKQLVGPTPPTINLNTLSNFQNGTYTSNLNSLETTISKDAITTTYILPTIKTLAFADDVIIFNNDNKDFQKTLEIINNFSSISNLYMNDSKSLVYTNDFNLSKQTHEIHNIHKQIKVLSLSTNPIYLGVPLIKVNWTEKLSQLKRSLQKIIFMDMDLYQRVIGINTYIYSQIYYLDQHHPLPAEKIHKFETFVKNNITHYLPHRLSINNIDWHGLHKDGGFGLINLSKQLQGRRGYYIYITIFPQQKLPYITEHPFIYMMKHLLQAITNQLLRNTFAYDEIFKHLYKQINQHHQFADTINFNFELMGTFNRNHIKTIPFWYLLLSNNFFFKRWMASENYSDAIISAFITYTIYIFPKSMLQEHIILSRNDADELQLLSFLTQPDYNSQHYEFDLTGIPYFYNIKYYLESWYNLVLIKENTEAPDVNIRNYSKTEYHAIFQKDFPWKIFEQQNQDVEINLNSFKHSSKKHYEKNSNFINNIQYWNQYLDIDIETWKNIIKNLAVLHNKFHAKFNAIFELYTGLLSKNFYHPCSFCQTNGGMYHTFFKCEEVIRIHSIVKLNKILPKDIIGIILQINDLREADTFIKFLIFLNKEYYKFHLHNNNQIITEEMIIRMKIIFLQEDYNSF